MMSDEEYITTESSDKEVSTEEDPDVEEAAEDDVEVEDDVFGEEEDDAEEQEEEDDDTGIIDLFPWFDADAMHDVFIAISVANDMERYASDSPYPEDESIDSSNPSGDENDQKKSIGNDNRSGTGSHDGDDDDANEDSGTRNKRKLSNDSDEDGPDIKRIRTQQTSHDNLPEIEESNPTRPAGLLPMPCQHAEDGSKPLPPTHTIPHSSDSTPSNCHCACIASWPAQ
ncbi:MAG: hypothetical protein LQ338_005085 [Usnochroma carphineum]|nr:MAG: hypothetical protein LQ338_005085 [Usnochroma carphineum]